MRPLRFSINTTLDGCCDHRAGMPDEETHQHATEWIAQADALLFGRVIYQMMEEAWRPPGMLDQLPEYTHGFSRAIDPKRKYVVSSTLEQVDWNAELVQGDLETAVRELKDQPGEGIATGGVQLPLALAKMGLIDEYEFLVFPRIAGYGPTPFAGLPDHLDLKLIDRVDFSSGAMALRYEPR